MGEGKRRNHRMLGKLSIKRQMIFLVTCFLVLPMLLFTYFFNRYMLWEVRQNVEVSVENSLIVTDVNLENLRITIINACISAASDAQTAEFLQTDNKKTEFEKNVFAKKIENMVTVNLAGAEIGGAIIGLNGETFNLYMGVENPLAKDFIENPEAYKTIIWSRQNTFDAAGAPYIVCTCPIYRNDTAVLNGISVVALAQGDFQAIINRSRNYESYEAVIVDEQDTIVSHQNEAMIGKNLSEELEFSRGAQGETIAMQKSDGQKFLYFDRGVPIGDGWKTVTLVSYDEVFSGIDRTARSNNIIIILLSCCTILGVVVISRTISKPIVKLRDYMADYPVNSKELSREGISSREVDGLYDSYTKQMNTIQELIGKIEGDKQKLSDLQFQSLQAQINPHFLFNTLNNIKMMAFIKGCDDVGKMIAELGKLLEVSIYFNTPMVTIGEELDYVTSYVNLQNIHFEGRMVLDNQIPKELWKYQIVKFTLQPILENSIKHGFLNSMDVYRIELSAVELPKSIVICVKDNGTGFCEEKLKEIREKLSSREETRRVGLYNINERIKLSFGAEFGLDIDSIEEEYTVVTVRIPKIEGERNAEGTNR
ncbi:MAG: sensor histidine kinase [Hungatella hathewayi]|nr:sensor histidine kinase [Hungatella hathewayi]